MGAQAEIDGRLGKGLEPERGIAAQPPESAFDSSYVLS
jgi:hypothetical protein